MHCRAGHRINGIPRAYWIARNLHRYRFWARQRVIKIIKANLCLPWLQSKFHSKIVFLKRHPCAVLASRIKMNWHPSLDYYRNQPNLSRDFLAAREGLFRGATTRPKKLALLWCIENSVPEQQIRDRQISVTSCQYETLVSDPEPQIDRLLSLMFDSPETRKRLLKRIMVRARPNPNSLERWKKELSPHLIDYTLACAERFNIDISMESNSASESGVAPKIASQPG